MAEPATPISTYQSTIRTIGSMSGRPSTRSAMRMAGRKSIIVVPGVQEGLHGLWQAWEGKSEWFDDVGLARDGGFPRVHRLYEATRYFFACFTLLAVVLNLYALTFRNVFQVIWRYEVRSRDFPWDWCIDNNQGFLFYNWVGPTFDVVGCGEQKIVRPDVVVALVEVVLIVVILLRSVWVMIRSLCSDDVNRWHSVARLCFYWIPSLQNFSALWSLRMIAPQTFGPRCAARIEAAFQCASRRPAVARSRSRRRSSAASNMTSEASSVEGDWKPKAWLALFLLSHLCLAFIGFDCFLVKARGFGQSVNLQCARDPERDCSGKQNEDQCRRQYTYECRLEQIANVLTALIFVNQVFAIVQVSHLVPRLFSSARALGDRAEAVRMTWEAMLAKHIWDDEESSCLKFAAVMLSFTDNDLYNLVIVDKSQQAPSDSLDSGVGETELVTIDEMPLNQPLRNVDRNLSLQTV